MYAAILTFKLILQFYRFEVSNSHTFSYFSQIMNPLIQLQREAGHRITVCMAIHPECYALHILKNNNPYQLHGRIHGPQAYVRRPWLIVSINFGYSTHDCPSGWLLVSIVKNPDVPSKCWKEDR